MSSQAESTAPDTEELAQFRQRWKEEIWERGHQSQESPPGSSQDQPAQSFSADTLLNSALRIYNHAVAEEQNKNISEATTLYRNTFHFDPAVDKAYHREEQERAQQFQNRLPSSSLPVAEKNLSFGDIKPFVTSQAAPSTPTPTLASLLQSWPQPLLFAPEDTTIGVPISRLPDELIISILSNLADRLDTNSIERFATVCRRARMLSLEMSIWRQLANSTLVPSQLSDSTVTLEQLALKYSLNYRQVFIEHPRLRLDGVYISVCKYMYGLGENPWVTVSHLITYRRFLRFLPNGKVLSYRGNEDQDIADVVRTLQPGSQRQGLFSGNWKLVGTRVMLKNLVCIISSGDVIDRYSFQMCLNLRSRPSLGRWNKLDLHRHESVNVETGEICPFPLIHERPFWFSKVKSYQ